MPHPVATQPQPRALLRSPRGASTSAGGPDGRPVAGRVAIGRVLAAGTAAGSLALLGLSGPAAAHISPTPSTITAGTAVPVSFTVAHGCDAQATTSLRFEIPESIATAAPYAHPGWEITVDKEPLATPVTNAHGETVTERTAAITFTSTTGLPADVRDTFTVALAAGDPAAAPVGTQLPLPIEQRCGADAVIAWNEVAAPGAEPDSVAHPAPVVTVAPGVSAGANEHQHGAVAMVDSTRSASEFQDALAAIHPSPSSQPVAVTLSIIALVGAGVAIAVAAIRRR